MSDRYMHRAKRTDNGEWIIGNCINDGVTGKVYIHADGNSVNESDKVGEEGYLRFVAYEINPSTICQCTGYKGIWEHDIFQCGEDRYQIEYSEESLTWRAESIFSSESIELGEFLLEEIDVIGNNFDNPKLLEGGAE